jgi:periplasmic divalent cation tolerance protein
VRIIFFYITTPDETIAKKLGHLAVEKKLAACANIFPIQSVFPWDNQLSEENEFVLVLKTIPQLSMDLKEFISENHPYEVPCIMNWEVEVNEAYGKWVNENVLPISSK